MPRAYPFEPAQQALGITLPPTADPGRHKLKRFRRNHPSSNAPKTAQKKAEILHAIMHKTEAMTAEKIAIATKTDLRAIKALIAQTRVTLQQLAPEYLKDHKLASSVAALRGDGTPAQWALERIAEGEQRVVEKDKSPSMPALTIGVQIGGLPASKPDPITAADVPALPGEVVADTP